VSTADLDHLVRTLQAEFRTRVRPGRVSEILGDYARSHQDWREFALFSEQHYTRNLVAREARFELMILCWGPGQASAIHNHEGQDCWMAVLDGEMEEERFDVPDPTSPGPLRSKGVHGFGPGQVAFIRDEMGLHLVRPRPGARAGGVTLHLYSLPYDDCNCYCPETGQVTRRKLGHHSIRGQIQVAPAHP
jgi:predicted metal-dependent enzyme (double-stranded beta helix superfamily)